MKQKKLFLAAILTSCSAVMFTACTDNDNPIQETNGTQVETPAEENMPETDQMRVSVTADVPTAVLSQFDANTTGAALVKRLPKVTAAITDDTKFVLIKGGDVNDIDMAGWLNVADMFLNNGYVGIETPTNTQMAVFVFKLISAVVERQMERWQGNFDMTEEQARALAERSEMVFRLSTRANNLDHISQTIDPGAIQAEMVIFSPTSYFYLEPFATEVKSRIYSEDDEGNQLESSEVTATVNRNGYENGLMADAAAEWMNEMENEHAEKATAAARAITRADANATINELMDPSETFTFYGHAAFRYRDNGWYRRSNRVKQVIRSWGVHEMESNKDYYYIKQNVTVSMGERDGVQIFYPKTGENLWSTASNYGDEWHLWYGAFLSKYVTSMDLTGAGTIFLEAAMPETKNGGTSKSISMGTSHSTTETIGVTVGVNAGYTEVPGANIGASLSGSYSRGWTDSRSFSIGYSREIKDLTVSKNTNGNKVSWTYDANKPEGYVAHDIYGADYSYCHQTVPEILVSDADLLNEICWSVSNPEGRYTINIFSQPETAALLESSKSSKNKIKTKYEYTLGEELNNFSHELLQPNRASQTWRMSITVDEWQNGFVAGALSEFEAYFSKKFPDIYRNVFAIADKDESSVQVADAYISASKEIFLNQEDILQGDARSFGIKKFTINWRCDNKDIKLKEGLTISTE